MAGDIVLQLRDIRYPGQHEMRETAADEIETLRAQLEAARKAFNGTALMMRGVDSWPDNESIVGHVDSRALRELRSALGLTS